MIYKRKRLLITTLTALIAMLFNIISPATSVLANTSENMVVNITTNKNTVKDGEKFILTLEYKPAEGKHLVPGEQITFTLPKCFQGITPDYPSQHFLYNEKTLSNGDKEVILTFKDGDETINGLGGYINISAVPKGIDEPTNERITVNVNGVSRYVDVTVDKGDETPNRHHVYDETLYKSVMNANGSERDSQGNIVNTINTPILNKKVEYSVAVNGKYESMHGVVVNDKIPSGMTLNTSSIRIYEIPKGGKEIDVTDKFKSNINATQYTLSVNLGDINSAYAIDYSVQIKQKKDSYKNIASIGNITSSTIVKGKEDSTMLLKYSIDPYTNEYLTETGMNSTVKYSVYANPNNKYIKNAVFTDVFPKGMELVPDSVSIYAYNVDGTGEWVYPRGSLSDVNISKNGLNINFGNTDKKYIIYYDLKVTSVEKNYNNNAKLSYDNTSSTVNKNLTYEKNAGAIGAIKKVDKAEIKKGDDNIVSYNIDFHCYGIFEPGYLNVVDNIDPRVKILSVEVPESFTYKLEGNKIVASNIKETEYGQPLTIKIKTDFSGVPNGTTIYNTAYINKTPSKKVETKKGYSFKAIKTDALNSKKFLKGAEFNLLDSNKNIIKDSLGKDILLTSDSNGIIKSDVDNFGTYYLKEVKAPTGYYLNTDLIKIDIPEASIGTTVDVGNVKNTQIKGSFEISKFNEEGNLLDGAEFTVTGPNGFNKVVTATGGKVTLNDLLMGTYKIEETKAPDGYTLDSSIKSVTIDDKNASTLQKVEFTDKKILGGLKVIKTDESGANKLSGAEFTVTGPNGFNKFIITDENGLASLSNLEWGTYTITETDAPDGYNLDSTTQTITIDNTNVNTVQSKTFKDSKILGRLKITKTDENGSEKLSGAAFEITGPNNFKKNVKTDESGSVSLDNLLWGTYTITEIDAPKGYNLDSTAQTITFDNKNVDTLQSKTFKDSKILGNLEITKTDESGNEKLSGAEFTVTGPNNFNKVIKTDENGIASLDNLAWGTYLIKETLAPTGYEIDSKDTTVTIDSESAEITQKISVKDKKKVGSIEVFKTDKYGLKLPNAEFTLTYPDGKTEKAITNYLGVATFSNLAWGTYTVKETNAPLGYNISKESKTIEIKSDNVSETQHIVVEDTRILGSLSVTKFGENNTKLKDAEFTVTGPNNFERTIITDDNGLASLNGLLWGTYEVKETKAPDGYSLNLEIKTVEIGQKTVSNVQALEVTDVKILGKLNITKIGENKDKLKGAKFLVKGPNGFSKEIITDKNGLATLDNLTYGDYTYKEIEAPEGYILDPTIFSFNIETNNQVIDKTATNEKIRGNIQVIKVDSSTDAELQGATFELMNSKGNMIQEATTDENGVVTFSNLEYGSYSVKEKVAPKGYELSSEVKTFEVKNHKETLEYKFADSRKVGSLEIKKVDSKNNPLEGAKFLVMGPNKFEKTIITDKNGVASLDNLAWGTYVIKETEAPKGYNLNKKVKTVVIDNESVLDVQKVEIADTQILGKLKITKSDANKNLLEGAIFTVTGPNGFSKEMTTDKNGEISLNNLQWGTYDIKETKAPDGYNLNSEEKSIKIDYTNVSDLQEISVVDTQITGKLEITKFGENNDKLQGAKFLVKGPNGFSKEIITDENGQATLDNLIYGDYTYQEIEAPKGYVLDQTTFSFSIKNNNEVVDKTATNEKIRGNIQITKIDGSSKEKNKLQGAVFGVMDSYGTVIAKATTDEEGVATFSNLEYGKYSVKEIEAPKGYSLSSEIKNFTVEKHESTIEDTFSDNRKFGSLEVKKVDSTDNTLLSGAEFLVIGPNDFSKTIITDENGVASLDNLAWGTYVIKESKGPEGYNLDKQVKNVIIDNKNVSEVQSIEVKDTRKLGSLKITKINEKGNILEGAEFTVTGDNDFSKIITTGKDGVANLENLPWGSYEITESKAPTGYNLNSAVYKVTVDSKHVSKTQEIKVTDTEILGSLKLLKTNENEEENLQGAEFTVNGPNGFSTVITTDKNGEANLENLPYGDYSYEETKAPTGYNLDKTIYKFSIKTNKQVVENTIKDTLIKGNLKLTKTDSEDGSKLEGAVFEIMDSTGKVVSTKTTDKNGEIQVNDLAYGKYTYKEIKAPEGYVLNSSILPFEINTNGETISENPTNDKIRGDIQIIKVDSEGGKTLEGATFDVLNSNGKVVSTVTTDKNGVATVSNLPYGTYTYKEVKAPTGYVLSNEVKNLKIVEHEKTIKDKFEDNKIKGSVKITKVNSEDTSILLSGAEFTIKNSKGEVVGTAITNEKGVVEFTNLPYGKYTYEETKAPKGYLLDNTIFNFEITNNGEVLNFTAKDDQIKGNIQISKVDSETNKALPKAEFEIKGVKNGVTKTVVTDNEGVATLSDLPYGDYTFQEVKAPTGYVLDSTIVPFSVLEHGKTLEFTAKNTEIKGGLKITKVDSENNNLLENAEFLLKSKDGSIVKTEKTNEKGIAEFTNIPYGTYTYKEVKAPEGYLLNPSEYEININTDGQLIEVTAKNDKIRGNLQIIKINSETNEVLEGAKFDIKDSTGKVIQSIVTNKQGVATVSGLAYGEYRFQEVGAPTGYILDSKEIPFTVKENSKTLEFTAKNNQIKGGIKITKLDSETNKVLEGAEFTLKNSYGKIIEKGITDENGVVEFNNLPYGSYSYEETKAPRGYVLEGTAVKFDITENAKILDFTAKNTEIKGGIKIVKTDSKTDKVLEGAEFTIRNSVGEIIDTVITDKNGIAEFTNLPYGSYSYEETKAPKGYVLNPTVVKFNISENGKVLEFTAKNTMIEGNIQIVKVDSETGNTLSGAKFAINDAEGKVIQTIVTDNVGVATVKNLAYGEYTFQEIGAPTGYILDSKPIEFKIYDNNETLDFKVKNTKIKGGIKITKMDSKNNKVLSGAEFLIKNSKGEVVAKAISDELGIAEVNNLPYGSYTFEETKAPVGYILDNTVVNFEITENNKILEYTVKNEQDFGDKGMEKHHDSGKDDPSYKGGSDNSSSKKLPQTGAYFSENSVLIFGIGLVLLSLILAMVVNRKRVR